VTKTERLYYTDCYLREFQARVLAAQPAAHRYRIYLDRSAFYPESGGQPADAGTLAGLPVEDVVDEGEAVAHLVKAMPSTDVVVGRIDWERRFDHMQQHSGQHLLSAAFERQGKYKTVSFHLGAQVSTIDLDSDRLGRHEIEEAEDLANRVIFEDRPIRMFFRRAAEVSQLDLRKPTLREGEVRLVEVEDFDLSACGGTHVNRTGAVGLLLVRKFDRMKGLTRVEFLCGGRALEAARRDFQLLGESARRFSGAPADLPMLIAKHDSELRAVTRNREKLSERLAEYCARELVGAAPEGSGRKIVRHIFASDDLEDPKLVAHAIARQALVVALLGVRGRPAKLYFAQSVGGPSDLGTLLKQIVGRVGGKGGGTRDFAQGGGLDESRLEEALEEAERRLTN
jgi:alanyl-tRNA synthetase